MLLPIYRDHNNRIEELLGNGYAPGTLIETPNDDNIDGRLVLNMNYHPPLQLNAEVKKELRAVHLNYIELEIVV